MTKTSRGATSVQYPYRAVIFGEEHIVKGWQGGNVVTDKGEFVFRRLRNKQVASEWPGEIDRVSSDFPVQSARFLEVATLQPVEQGGWLLNGHLLWPLELQPAGCRLNSITNSEVLRVHKGDIRAVAWVQLTSTGGVTLQLDMVLDFWKTARLPIKAKAPLAIHENFHLNLFAGWSKPIWLTEFHATGSNRNAWLEGLAEKLQSNAPQVTVAEMLKQGINPFLAGVENIPAQSPDPAVKVVKSNKQKAVKAPQPKPVARFENDFSIAIIPQKNQKETSFTVETELRNFIKRIIQNGGNIPRTRLRSGKSDTYQPEKLLESVVAKRLVKAKLLGKNKSGRTTVFWAKYVAE